MSENAQKDTEVTAQENKKAPSKKEKKEKIFGQRVDLVAFLLVMVVFVISIAMLATGAIQPF